MESQIFAYSCKVAPGMSYIVLVDTNGTRMAILMKNKRNYNIIALFQQDVHTTYLKDHKAFYLILRDRLLIPGQIHHAAGHKRLSWLSNAQGVLNKRFQNFSKRCVP